MINNLIAEAVSQHKLLSFTYKNLYREVAPFTYGRNTKNNDVLSAYQIGGMVDKGQIPTWKLFTVEDILNLTIVEGDFPSTPIEYRRGDSRMVQIYYEH